MEWLPLVFAFAVLLAAFVLLAVRIVKAIKGDRHTVPTGEAVATPEPAMAGQCQHTGAFVGLFILSGIQLALLAYVFSFTRAVVEAVEPLTRW